MAKQCLLHIIHFLYPLVLFRMHFSAVLGCGRSCFIIFIISLFIIYFIISTIFPLLFHHWLICESWCCTDTQFLLDKNTWAINCSRPQPTADDDIYITSSPCMTKRAHQKVKYELAWNGRVSPERSQWPHPPAWPNWLEYWLLFTGSSKLGNPVLLVQCFVLLWQTAGRFSALFLPEFSPASTSQFVSAC